MDNKMNGKFIVELEDSKQGKLVSKNSFNTFEEAFDNASMLALQIGTNPFQRYWYNSKENCIMVDYGSHTNFIKIKLQENDKVTNLEEELANTLGRLKQ